MSEVMLGRALLVQGRCEDAEALIVHGLIVQGYGALATVLSASDPRVVAARRLLR